MRPRTVRRVVALVFLGGVAGMIVGSIADNNGTAITFGIITAMAAVGLILVTSVAPPGADRTSGHDEVDPEVAADVEARIQALVADGADEDAVRRLVRRVTELGG